MKFYKTASLTEKGLEALSRLPSHYEEAKLLAWIKEHPGKGLPRPLSRFESLQRKGWLVIKGKNSKARTGPLMRRFVRFQEGLDLQSVLEGKSGPLGAGNEVEFLKTVFSHKTILLRDLTAKFTNGSYLANKWIKRGVLKSGEMAVYRNPAGEFCLTVPGPC